MISCSVAHRAPKFTWASPLRSGLRLRERQMDLIRIKRLKTRFSTLFQRETIPQLSRSAQACEGGELGGRKGSSWNHYRNHTSGTPPEAREMPRSNSQPWVFRQGRDRSWCKQAPSLLLAFMGIKGAEKRGQLCYMFVCIRVLWTAAAQTSGANGWRWTRRPPEMLLQAYTGLLP